MNKKQWQNRVEELEKELAELKANPPKREYGERWKPEDGEIYWCVNEDYETDCFTWLSDDFDDDQFNNFNIFKTKEEAEFARERTKVMRELDTWAMDITNNTSTKYFIGYIYDFDIVDIFERPTFTDSPHTFRTKEIAKKAIEAIGEDRLKKYYFRVGD